MFLEWVFGVLFRPAETFAKARHQMRLEYWWIVLSASSLAVVMVIFGPYGALEVGVPWPDAALVVSLAMLTFFDLQSLCLLASARLFRWNLSWVEAMKYMGLCWSFLLVENIVTFYPYLVRQWALSFWLAAPLSVWQVISLTAGVRRLTAFPTWKAALLSLLALIPLRLAIFLLVVAVQGVGA